MILTPTTIIVGTVLIIVLVYIIFNPRTPELLRNVLIGVLAVGILLALFGLLGIFPRQGASEDDYARKYT